MVSEDFEVGEDLEEDEDSQESGEMDDEQDDLDSLEDEGEGLEGEENEIFETSFSNEFKSGGDFSTKNLILSSGEEQDSLESLVGGSSERQNLGESQPNSVYEVQGSGQEFEKTQKEEYKEVQPEASITQFQNIERPVFRPQGRDFSATRDFRDFDSSMFNPMSEFQSSDEKYDIESVKRDATDIADTDFDATKDFKDYKPK